MPLSLIAFAAAQAQGGPIVDKASEAERLLDSNDASGAFDAIKAAFDEVWARMPLTVLNVTLIDSAAGFGNYIAKDGDVFKVGQPLVVYAELAGYALGTNSTGGNEIGIDVDIDLKNLAGATIWSGEGIMKVRQPVKVFNKEFFMKMSLNLDGAPRDRYLATFKVKDVNSDKTTSFDVAFELAQSGTPFRGRSRCRS